jgi:hypothetical protein
VIDAQLWDRPRYAGHGPAMNGFGGVAAPLLAGFSLASIVSLLTTENKPEYAEWALMALSLATGSFLFAIQFTFLALGYWVMPTDHLQLAPEARRSYEVLEEVVVRQRTAVREFTRYADTAWNLLHVGVVALLCGVAAVLLPEGGWSGPRSVAFGAVVVCLLVQLAWASDPLFGGRLSEWAMRAVPKQVQNPPNIGAELVALVADERHRSAMQAAARHRNRCSWTTLEAVDISGGGLTHFRGQSVAPTVETWRQHRYFAMTGSGDDVVVVLPDRVLYGCKEHVLERLGRFAEERDAEQIEEIRAAVERA